MSKKKKTLRNIAVGQVLAVTAVDWGIHTEQTLLSDKYTIIHANLYGEVIHVTDEGFALAPQVFADGGARCVLVVPFVCVQAVEVLKVVDR